MTKIKSKKEYWIEHKKFRKELKQIIKTQDFPKLNPLFDKAERKGLFSKEDITKWRTKISKGFQGKR